MKRTEKDVAWSTIAQGFKCLWCAQPAIEDGQGSGSFICANDPECMKAKEVEVEAERLEAEIERSKASHLRTMGI